MIDKRNTIPVKTQLLEIDECCSAMEILVSAIILPFTLSLITKVRLWYKFLQLWFTTFKEWILTVFQCSHYSSKLEGLQVVVKSRRGMSNTCRFMTSIALYSLIYDGFKMNLLLHALSKCYSHTQIAGFVQVPQPYSFCILCPIATAILLEYVLPKCYSHTPITGWVQVLQPYSYRRLCQSATAILL